ncbi:hypothetical protein [Moraxella osloensis]|uniref:hypothetical protein n=1 Tax=Faucicola osloensis TaxID=34062 RepID=UPI002006566B|nr:hypothetical protein [Moraxella osloensis]MCK6053368.1 hypothetical protein [Moraxella osloensis]
MRLDMYAQGEAKQTEPSIWAWLKKDQIKNENLYRSLECQDDLIRQLMARQDRQGKWIAFLLLVWVFSVVFMWFGVLMTV